MNEFGLDDRANGDFMVFKYLPFFAVRVSPEIDDNAGVEPEGDRPIFSDITALGSDRDPLGSDTDPSSSDRDPTAPWGTIVFRTLIIYFSTDNIISNGQFVNTGPPPVFYIHRSNIPLFHHSNSLCCCLD